MGWGLSSRPSRYQRTTALKAMNVCAGKSRDLRDEDEDGEKPLHVAPGAGRMG